MEAGQVQVAAVKLDEDAPVQTSPLLIPDVFGLVADQLSHNERNLLMRLLYREARDLLPTARQRERHELHAPS